MLILHKQGKDLIGERQNTVARLYCFRIDKFSMQKSVKQQCHRVISVLSFVFLFYDREK